MHQLYTCLQPIHSFAVTVYCYGIPAQGQVLHKSTEVDSHMCPCWQLGNHHGAILDPPTPPSTPPERTSSLYTNRLLLMCMKQNPDSKSSAAQVRHAVQESLDKALTRPGRFDRIVQLTLPDMQGRLEILQHYMKVIIQIHTKKAIQLTCKHVGFCESMCHSITSPAIEPHHHAEHMQGFDS